MSNRDTIAHWLRELSPGDGAFRLDQQGVCLLSDADGATLRIEVPEASGRVFLLSHIGSWRDDNRADLFEKLLKANLFNLETNGATLAIDERSQRVALCYGHAVQDLDPGRFESVVSEFIETARSWRERLAQLSAAPEQSAAVNGDDSAWTMIRA
ncbi:MAG: hypothetical protein V7608_5214 [Hyphomicrobiales bacterium]|jgi:hypothetical protein